MMHKVQLFSWTHHTRGFIVRNFIPMIEKPEKLKNLINFEGNYKLPWARFMDCKFHFCSQAWVSVNRARNKIYFCFFISSKVMFKCMFGLFVVLFIICSTLLAIILLRSKVRSKQLFSYDQDKFFQMKLNMTHLIHSSNLAQIVM